MAIKISTVIPTYNRADKVQRAIASVQAQTHPVDEIIVVDDGSTDETREILERFGTDIRYLRKQNGGASAARNHGWQQARNEWIAFLDSDDQWHPEKIARQVETLSNYPDAQCCLTGALNDDGERLDHLEMMHPELATAGHLELPKADPSFFLFKRHPFIQSLLVTRTALLKAGGYDETLRVAEDTRLLYQLVLNHGFIALNEPLVTIERNRPQAGLSNQMDPKTAQIRFACYARVQSEAYWQFLPINLEVADHLRKNLSYFVSRWAEIACVNRNYDLAKSLGKQGVALASTWRDRVRSLLAILAPSILGDRCRPKWK